MKIINNNKAWFDVLVSLDVSKTKKIGLRNHGECTGFGIAPQVLETEHSSKNFRYLKWMNSHLCKLFSGLCKGNPTPQNSRK